MEAIVSTPLHLLTAAGAAREAWAGEAEREFKAAAADPNTVMTTPLVMEIIAEKV